jgi:hypothetical protein
VRWVYLFNFGAYQHMYKVHIIFTISVPHFLYIYKETMQVVSGKSEEDHKMKNACKVDIRIISQISLFPQLCLAKATTTKTNKLAKSKYLNTSSNNLHINVKKQ